MPIHTFDALLLLGWMQREDAVSTLCKECVFETALTEAQAQDLWQGYREKVNNLPERDTSPPPSLALSNAEERLARHFLTATNNLRPPDIREIVKIDLTRLILRQFLVVLDIADGYRSAVSSLQGWVNKALPSYVSPGSTQVECQLSGTKTTATIKLPHGEFLFLPSSEGTFGLQQGARQVTVMKFGGRMLLWAGYHRSYARLCMSQDANARSALVALTSNTFDCAPTQPDGYQPLRDLCCSARPAFLTDFFNDDFFMRVKLRKKRYEMIIRAEVVPVNEEG